MKNKEVTFSKRFDILLGIPLLFAISGARPNVFRKIPKDVRKIAVLSIGSARDIILAYPLLFSIKRAYPYSEMTFFAKKDVVEFAAFVPSVDRVVEIFPESLKKTYGVVDKEKSFDLLFDIGTWTRYEAIVSSFIKSAFKVGFRTAKEYRHFVYDMVMDYIDRKSATENYLRLLAPLGIPKREPTGSVFRGYHSFDKTKTIIFNLFSDEPSQKVREWSFDSWKKLAVSISKMGYRVAIVGFKKDVEDAERFIDEVGSACDVDYLVGRLDFKTLTETIARSAVVISVDAAILYLAGLIGVKTIGLYGATSPKKYAMQAKNFHYVRSDGGCLSCQDGYGDEVCKNKSDGCMSFITFDKVNEEFINFIKEDTNGSAKN